MNNKIDMDAAVDAAMVEMENISPPLRRSECERLVKAALGAYFAATVVERPEPVAWMFKNDNNRIERVIWWEPEPDSYPEFWPKPIPLYAELPALLANQTDALTNKGSKP